MSEKRFIRDGKYVFDTERETVLDIDLICILLNRFADENEQLKNQLQMIKKIIQTQITETEEDLRISVRGGMPTGSLYSEIEFLEKLKKECYSKAIKEN